MRSFFGKETHERAGVVGARLVLSFLSIEIARLHCSSNYISSELRCKWS